MKKPTSSAELDERSGAWNAAAAAFALVATADGDLAASERDRFAGWLGERTKRAEPRTRALAQFDELAARLLGADPALAHREATAFLRACESNEERAFALAAAQAAVVADERIDDREEVILRDICACLGVAPDQ
jgi:tellurite resistance protein